LRKHAPDLEPQARSGSSRSFAVLRSACCSWCGEQSPKLLRELQRGAQAQDADAIVRAAHSLRSSSANLGATRLASLCQELETSARLQQIDAASRLLAALESEYLKVCAVLREAEPVPV
jgi:HPt (histidine-containing phosphotransfer) domain-containing protein